MVILGDSHAGRLFYGVAAEDEHRNWLAVSNLACPPTLGISVKTDLPGCAEKMQAGLPT